MTNTQQHYSLRKLTKCLAPHELCSGKYFDRYNIGLVVECNCPCHQGGSQSKNDI